jgi:hypothetical protein
MAGAEERQEPAVGLADAARCPAMIRCLLKMKNWKEIALASDVGLSDADVDRIAPGLDALEQAFRPLAATLSFEVEPAVVFRAGEGEE